MSQKVSVSFLPFQLQANEGGVAHTLKARDYKDPQCVISGKMVKVLDNHPMDSRMRIKEDNVFQTMGVRGGTRIRTAYAYGHGRR